MRETYACCTLGLLLLFDKECYVAVRHLERESSYNLGINWMIKKHTSPP